jgi:hypothetical protein
MMDRKILIKEIDKYTNTKKEKVVSEYLIYYVINGSNVVAYTELGDKNKKNRVNELLIRYFVNENDINWEHATYPIEEIKLK